MKALLDTHAFLWYLMADGRLSAAARTTIANLGNQLFLSKASLWEIAIKVSIGKLTLPAPFASLIPQKIQEMAIHVLEIELDHIAAIVSLPFHHKDPFDRMLVTTCLAAQLPIVSADSAFDIYGVARVW
jgi:PIN domain nuclease of toxin-antitoxin system